MNCPQCGTPQPFDLKCVNCNVDIAASLKSERHSLRIYRVALFVLFLVTLWFAQDRQPSKFASQLNEAKEKTSAPQAASQAPSTIKFLAPPPGKDTELSPTVGVVFHKENFADYQILDSLRTNFKGEIRVLDDNEVKSWDDKPLVIIGADMAKSILASKAQYPMLLLSLQEDLSASFDPSQRVYGVASTLSADFELIVLHQLFEGINQFILISPDNVRKPNQGLLRDLNVRLDSLQADSVTLERELPATAEGTAVTWLHHVQADQIAAILALRSMEKTWSVVGIHSRELDSAHPLVELKLSPAGLGIQAAFLLRKIQTEAEISETDMFPKYALEVVVHYKKALDLGREDLINLLQERARRAGYQTKLLP